MRRRRAHLRGYLAAGLSGAASTAVIMAALRGGVPKPLARMTAH